MADICAICESAIQDLHAKSNSVSEFFSDASVTNHIPTIYEAIRGNKYPWNKVSVLNISEAVSKYNDYYQGLSEYVEKVLSLNESNEIDETTLTDALEKISHRDEEFRKSLFEGTQSDVTIDEAMKNVEYGTQVIEYVNSLVSDVNTLRAKYVPEKYQVIAEKAVQLQVNSLNSVVESVVDCVKDSFDKIAGSMDTRVPAGMKEIPKYQLF